MNALARVARLPVVVAGVLVSLFVIEGGLRLAGVSYPRTTEADNDLGILHRPGIEYWFRDEGEAFVRINSEGFRDRDRPINKGPAEVRMAVLGDSFVEALQVPAEDAFTQVLQTELSRRDAFHGKSVDVMNLGMSGYGTAQELLTLRTRVWKYSPDLVVLAFATGSDLSDNAKRLSADPGKPYFVLRDGSVERDLTFQTNIAKYFGPGYRVAYKLADISRLLQLLHRVKRNLGMHAEAAPQPWARHALGLGDGAIYSEPVTPDWKEAWEITEQLLVMMKNEVEEHGARFLVVTLTNAEQVHPDPGMRRGYIGGGDLLYPEKRIKACGQRHGFPVLNLARSFQMYAEEHHTCLHGFENAIRCAGHWNKIGHRLAGRLIAKKVIELERRSHLGGASMRNMAAAAAVMDGSRSMCGCVGAL